MIFLMHPYSQEAAGTCPAGVWWPEPCGVLQWLCWEVKAGGRQPGEGNRLVLLPVLWHGDLNFSGQRDGIGQLVLRFERIQQWHSSSGWRKEEISWLGHLLRFLLSRHKRVRGCAMLLIFLLQTVSSEINLLCWTEENGDVLFFLGGDCLNWVAVWIQKACTTQNQIFDLE